jgi:hypothetical protein
MICYNCGRQIQNETANFCEYCGASFREQAQAARPEAGQPFYRIPDIQQDNFQMRDQSQMMVGQAGMQEKPIGFMSWLGTYAILGALLFIPYFGWIGFVALLLFWAFSNKTPATKKNWARVTLIFVGIVMIFLIIALVAFSSLYYEQIMNGSFDFNSYYNNMMNSLQK